MKTGRPTSSNATVLVGLLPLLAGVGLCALLPSRSEVTGALFLAACYAVPLMLYELFVRESHRNISTGLDWHAPRSPDPGRVAVKLVGMTTMLSAVVAIHTVFRIYTVPQLQAPVTAALLLAPGTMLMIAAYFWFVDRRMVQPKDGYWQVGAFVCGKNREPDRDVLKDFLLGWAVKGFFLPIMFTYLTHGVNFIHDQVGLLAGGPVDVARYLIRVTIVLELTIVVVGYTMTARLFDAHIRSTNAYLGAWVVTLICYQPFNPVFFDRVFSFRAGADWSGVIGNYPNLMWPWLALLLLSFVAYVWATAIFGLRWSNLTHRGIITTGPYRITKHPDYVAKSAYFWLTAAPFLTASTPWAAFTGSVALLAVNGIYYARARMEEKHLSQDPEYVAYALDMNERSIFRHAARLLPILRYRAPSAPAAQPAALHAGPSPIDARTNCEPARAGA